MCIVFFLLYFCLKRINMYDELYKSLKTITIEWCYSIVDEFMNKNDDRILGMAKYRMDRGKGVNGGIIGSYKSKEYELFKQRLSPLSGGVVNLKLTGDTYNSMLIERIRNGIYEITSSDLKYDDLANKYGANQFGITEKEHEIVISEAIEYLINKINERYE